VLHTQLATHFNSNESIHIKRGMEGGGQTQSFMNQSSKLRQGIDDEEEEMPLGRISTHSSTASDGINTDQRDGQLPPSPVFPGDLHVTGGVGRMMRATNLATPTCPDDGRRSPAGRRSGSAATGSPPRVTLAPAEC
jgi:hypothetical protein